MITETREIYKCEHCRKVYQIKRFAIEHEPKCKKNPANKQKCLEGCQYLDKKEVTYLWDAYDGQHESKKEILFCSKLNQGVYPYWVSGLLQDDIEDEIPNEVMPKKCHYFKH
jgi:hypothetical protein